MDGFVLFGKGGEGKGGKGGCLLCQFRGGEGVRIYRVFFSISIEMLPGARSTASMTRTLLVPGFRAGMRARRISMHSWSGLDGVKDQTSAGRDTVCVVMLKETRSERSTPPIRGTHQSCKTQRNKYTSAP